MRARNIKPSLFKNEVLGVADPIHTVVFEGLWCLADREGRLEDRPLRIHAEVLPFREKAMTEHSLGWLESNGFIIRYEVDGNRYIQVVNFLKHQNPHQREAQSVVPAPEITESLPRIGQGTAKAMSSPADSPFLIPHSPVLIPSKGKAKPRKRGSTLPEDLELTEEMREYALKRFPDMDTSETFDRFKNHHIANATVRSDWVRTWYTWVTNAEKFGYARSRKREQRVATEARKVSPFDVYGRQPNGPGAVHDGVVEGAAGTDCSPDAQQRKAGAGGA